MNMRIRSAVVLSVTLLVVGPSAAASGETSGAPAAAGVAAAANPQLTITPVITGLDHPWDVASAPDGTLFVTERLGILRARLTNGTTQVVNANMADLWVSGETGLMGVETDPQFAANRRLYTCQGSTDSNNTVQVVAWTIDTTYTSAARVNDPLVGGIDGTSGRHGGCQLRFDNAGALIVGTGDAAWGTNPQDRFSLAGKTLRVDRFTGAGLVGNPFFGNPVAGDPRIFTYGHRNVQGLSLQPGTHIMWSVEHGSDRDDEVNRLTAGGDYGWNPIPLPYNEAVPMTAPGAVPAAWSSGFPTVATSGATFLQGSQWGSWEGALAVSSLKGSNVRIMTLDPRGSVSRVEIPPELDQTYGRIRAAELGPGGVLYLTTDAGSPNGRVLAVRAVSQHGHGPSAVSSEPNRVDLAMLDSENRLRMRSWQGSWSWWIGLGGIASSDPDVASWGPGRSDVFARGLDGALWHLGIQDGAPAHWQSLGGQLTSAPTAVSWGPDRIDVFARGLDGAMWSNAWDGLRWIGWYPLGGQLSSEPEVSSTGPNRLNVFARGLDGALWMRTWTGTQWQPWSFLGGQLSSGPGSIAPNSNRIDAFARGLDGAMWSTTWSAITGWAAWEGHGGRLASAPDASSRSSSSIDVFATGVDGGIWRRSWNGATWLSWTPVV